uniref:Uncharacterized protein n=1 Tax=Tanacetum cinerariifolium TaxID=118510 RepID=A0A699K1F9_TANCI|nr:hypothetical protein [Tanacetum cinerariifolium]
MMHSLVRPSVSGPTIFKYCIEAIAMKILLILFKENGLRALLSPATSSAATLQFPLVSRHSALSFIYASASDVETLMDVDDSRILNGHAELLLPAAFDFSLGVNDTYAFYIEMTSKAFSDLDAVDLRIEDNLLNDSSATRTAHPFSQTGHAGNNEHHS